MNPRRRRQKKLLQREIFQKKSGTDDFDQVVDSILEQDKALIEDLAVLERAEGKLQKQEPLSEEEEKLVEEVETSLKKTSKKTRTKK